MMKKEKKTKIVTVRMTSEQHARLDARAEQAGMKLGKYILDRLEQEDGITPSLRREVYFRIQMIRDAAQPGYEDTKKIQKECDALWHCFR